MNTQIPLKIHKYYRLQWEESQKKHVLLYAEGMIQLNESAALILQLCDGQHTSQEIINTLEKRFPDDQLSDDVYSFLQEAYNKRWITEAK
jgi:pyrroloquinoline quinone biosynthesis protein D